MGTTSFSGPLLHHGKDDPKKWYAGLPIWGDPDFQVFFDDFDMVAQDQTNDWTVVKDTGASVAIGADALNGTVVLTSAATTDNDGASIQGNEVFALGSGKKLWFETRLQVSDADQMDVFAGLTINFATNPEAVLSAADRVGFQIDDGNASILCKSEKSSTETSTDSGVDASDATYVKLGFRWDGSSKVEFFVDRALVATHTTNNPDDENLTPALFELSGNSTGTKSMTADYVMVIIER